MREIIFLIGALTLGKLVALFNYNLGFNVTFFLILFFIFGAQLFKLKKINYFKQTSMERFQQLNISVSEPEPQIFLWRIQGIRVSSAQLVFHAYDVEKKYLIVCGSWWFGCLENNHKIYRKESACYNRIL